MSLNHNQLFEAHVESAKQLTAGRLNNLISVQGANAIRPGLGYRMTQTPGGTSISIIKRRAKAVAVLPFEITSANVTGLKAAAGVIDGDSHAETVKTFTSAPSDGTWYLEAKTVIDADTGAITATAAQWIDTESTATTTDFFYTIGYVEIVTVDDVQSFTITQSNYGPIYVLIHGAYDAKWGATMF